MENGGYPMSKPMIMRKRAKIVALILFLFGIVIITYLNNWWPGIMLVVGVPLAILQYLQGRHYDMGITLFVFLGAWVTVQFNIQWQIFLPVLFTIGGVYIFFREWIESRTAEEEEFEEEKDESEED